VLDLDVVGMLHQVDPAPVQVLPLARHRGLHAVQRGLGGQRQFTGKAQADAARQGAQVGRGQGGGEFVGQRMQEMTPLAGTLLTCQVAGHVFRLTRGGIVHGKNPVLKCY
jgi:hypothetical protein